MKNVDISAVGVGKVKFRSSPSMGSEKILTLALHGEPILDFCNPSRASTTTTTTTTTATITTTYYDYDYHHYYDYDYYYDDDYD